MSAFWRGALRNAASKMMCPHCKKKVPRIWTGEWAGTVCPHCTRELYGPEDPRRR